MTYDQDYQTPEYFGEPFPELITFLGCLPTRGLVIDMGCGQGRNAIPLARMGFEVLGLDLSKIGIEQMLQSAKEEGLRLQGHVADMYTFTDIQGANVILLDSLFHFQKKDKPREAAWIQTLIKHVRPGCLIVFCIQDSGKKVGTLMEILTTCPQANLIHDENMKFRFNHVASGHQSTTAYRLIVIRITTK